MRIPIYQVDAFASRLFGGNPAAVMPMEAFPAEEVMQAIAAENNLSETAFLVAEDGNYHLRWFTPEVEVPLCGHATLASGAVVLDRLEPGRESVVFLTASGPLTVSRAAQGYGMDFPARPSAQVPVSQEISDALGVAPVEVWEDDFFLLALVKDAATVRNLAPKMDRVAALERTGLVVTAAGDEGHDFVSRFFAPAKGIAEDPVTGSAHCMLTPFWAARLGKASFSAFQASARGGELLCRLKGERVEIEGQCVFYLEGKVEIEESVQKLRG
jgi:PhzF family phenazine biosynthesis protein